MKQTASRVECVQRSQALRRLLTRHPCMATADYRAEDYAGRTHIAWDFVEVLVVGAGGIGCEVLHCLAMSGFASLTILDMDRIELTNLNRQFLFTSADVGQYKSEVAARAVMRRCPGVRVQGVVGRAEAQSDAFYADFFVVVLAVDSFETRRWVNRTVARLARWAVMPRRELEARWRARHGDAHTSSPDTASNCHGDSDGEYVYCMRAALPLFDTASGGFQGQCRVIDMAYNATACIECSAYLYEESNKSSMVAMCTLANTPRSREHCVLYAQLKLWPERHPREAFDSTNAAHIRWVTQEARTRQATFAIAGPDITEGYTLGVVRHIVPSVSFPNSLVAGQVVLEVVKYITGVGPTLDNYFFVDCAATASGTRCARQRLCAPRCLGLTTSTAGCESCCPICSPLYLLRVDPDCTPRELARRLVRLAHRALHRTRDCDSDEENNREVDGTLSLLFTRTHAVDAVATSNCGSEADRLLADGPQEVYLCFAAGHPCAHAITGESIRDILQAASHTAPLLSLWCDTARQDVRVFAEYAARSTRGEAWSMRAVVSPHACHDIIQ